MGHVYLNIHGEGTANCTNPEPTVDDPNFTIYMYPMSHEGEVTHVQAYTSYDEPIATMFYYDPVIPAYVCDMTYRPIWNNVYVDIYFSGSTPPEPPGPTSHWIIPVLAKAANRWRL
jgi:hypothetical protein